MADESDRHSNQRRPGNYPIRKTIRVLPHETVQSIAKREYGDGSKWEIIFKPNQWRFDNGDPESIYPGMELDIPAIDALEGAVPGPRIESESRNVGDGPARQAEASSLPLWEEHLGSFTSELATVASVVGPWYWKSTDVLNVRTLVENATNDDRRTIYGLQGQLMRLHPELPLDFSLIDIAEYAGMEGGHFLPHGAVKLGNGHS